MLVLGDDMARLIILLAISVLLLLVGAHVVLAESMGYTVTVNVFNVNDKPAITVPGVVYGILVNSTNMQGIAMAYMNDESQLVFNGVLPGTYVIYVYYYPNSTVFNHTEYWGSLTIDVPEHLVYNFTRDMPWIMYVTSTFNITNDSFSIIVYINNTQEKNLTGKVTVYVSNTESMLGANTLSQSVNLSPGTNSVTFNYTPTQQGTYYIYVILNVTIPQPLGRSIITDQHGWEQIMAVYLVNFIESGLPTGMRWSVSINGTIKSSTSNVITILLPKGTYKYDVKPISGYIANVTGGSIVVNGLEPEVIPIHFRRAVSVLSDVIIAVVIIVILFAVTMAFIALWFRSRNTYDDVATA